MDAADKDDDDDDCPEKLMANTDPIPKKVGSNLTHNCQMYFEILETTSGKLDMVSGAGTKIWYQKMLSISDTNRDADMLSCLEAHQPLLLKFPNADADKDEDDNNDKDRPDPPTPSWWADCVENLKAQCSANPQKAPSAFVFWTIEVEIDFIDFDV